MTNLIHSKPKSRVREFAEAFKFRRMTEMAALFYPLCTLTAALCAWLLLRSYYRSRYRLLLWGGLCFAG